MSSLMRNALVLIAILALLPSVSFSQLTYEVETYGGVSYTGNTYGDALPEPYLAFNFNDDEEPTYIDDSGNGRNATCPTECPFWSATSGKGGSGGVTFIADGGTVDEVLNLPNIPWSSTDEFTLDFDVSSTVDNTWGENNGWIFRSGLGNIAIQGSSGGALTARAGIDGTTPNPITDGTEVDTTYHRVTLVFIGNGSANPNRISWYIDGIKVSGEDLTGSRTLDNAVATIGLNDAGANEIDATLDNFRLFLVALTDAEILTLSTLDVPDL